MLVVAAAAAAVAWASPPSGPPSTRPTYACGSPTSSSAGSSWAAGSSQPYAGPPAAPGPCWWRPGSPGSLGNFTGVQSEVVAWLSDQLVYLHRGFLVHLLVTYPDGPRPRAGRGWRSLRATWRRCCPPCGRDPMATVVLSALLVGYCVLDHRRSRGARRRARRQALWAAAGLGAGAVGRSGGARRASARQREPTFAAGLPGRPVRDRRRPAGGPRDRPTGSAPTSPTSSWSSGPSDPATCGPPCRRPWATRRSTSATGSPTPAPSSPRTGGRWPSRRGLGPSVTYVEHDGEVVAALVHDQTVLEDPQAQGGRDLGDQVGGREQPPAGRGPSPAGRPRSVATADPRDA